MTAGTVPGPEAGGALAVLRNRPFLLLWLSQLATQIVCLVAQRFQALGEPGELGIECGHRLKAWRGVGQ